MSLILALTLLQTKAKVDPRIAQDWTATVATGFKSALLSLKPDGRFSMRYVESAGGRDAIRGTYTVAPMAEAKPGARRVLLRYDLASLRKSGMPTSQIEAMRRRHESGAVGMSLVFYPEVPVLTDIMTAHFVPVRRKDAALKRLANWKPF